MRMTQTIAVWAAATELMATAVFAALSDPVLVDATSRAKHWETVFTNTVPLRWNWVTNAESAILSIEGMSTSFTTNVTTTVSNVVWHVFASDAPLSEDLYALTLVFRDNNQAVVGVQTARLAVVTGAFGGTTVNAVAASRDWTNVKANKVLPYDALWTVSGTNATAAQAVIAKAGGESRTNAFSNTAGYFGWKIRNGGWGYGTFDLALTFAGITNMWSAELIRALDGTAVSVR
jgi:hypothetical protein